MPNIFCLSKTTYKFESLFRKMMSERIVLRPWRDDDAEVLFKYALDPEVGPAAGWDPHPSVEYSREVIRTVFSAPETYAVELCSTGEPIGCIGIVPAEHTDNHFMSDTEAEVGYWIARPYWGQGLIPEAMQMFMSRCFTELGYTALWCSSYENNIKSLKVQRKCGFSFHHSIIGNEGLTVCYARLTGIEWRDMESRF